MIYEALRNRLELATRQFSGARSLAISHQSSEWMRAASGLYVAAKNLRDAYVDKSFSPDDIITGIARMNFFGNQNDRTVGSMRQIGVRPGSIGWEIIIDQYLGSTGRLVRLSAMQEGITSSETPPLERLTPDALNTITLSLRLSQPIPPDVYREHLELISG